jgi:hypothetical protein
MQAAAIERRGRGGTRVPIDAPVELVHAGDDEPFLADVINLGLGGLSMRASFLPDVGERLACSFEAQPGREIRAAVEVVWVADKRGEFGLRFVDLDEGQRRTVREIVAGFYRPPKPAAIAKPPPEKIRVMLDGVSTPVIATVIDRGVRTMMVEQALPFLKLETGLVDEHGRRGRIVSVDLAVEGDTPRLLLDLAFEETTLVDPPPADATVPDFDALEDEEVSEVRSVSAAGNLAAPRVEVVREPSVQIDMGPLDAPPRSEAVVPATSEPIADEPRPDQSVRIVHHRPAAGEPRIDDSEHDVDPELRPSLARAFTSLPFDRERIDALYARMQPYLAIAWAHIVRIGAKAFAFGAALLEKTSPRLKQASAGAIAFTRSKLRRARVRRTTAPPPKDSNFTRVKPKSRAPKEEPAHRRKIGRYVLVGLLAVAAVLVLLYAFDEEPEVVAPAPSVPERVIESIRVEPPPAHAIAPVDVAADIAPADVAPVEAAPDPEAGDVAAEPEVEAREPGPMPPPTFPSVSNGAPSPESVPSDSPYAVDVAEAPSGPLEAGPSFGQESVSNGETYSLRMSQPVRSVAGRALSNGFVVEIAGALSLDRAGPIARNHPLVERAVILNRGDHAELTIEFTEGAAPAYRVVPRGPAIEVTIARR